MKWKIIWLIDVAVGTSAGKRYDVLLLFFLFWSRGNGKHEQTNIV